MTSETAIELSPSVEEPSLTSTLEKAKQRLGAYIESPREQILREYQIDVMQALYNHEFRT